MTTVHFADQLAQLLSRLHGQELRWTACGWSADDGSQLVIVTDRAAVTCRGCKRTRAWKATTCEHA